MTCNRFFHGPDFPAEPRWAIPRDQQTLDSGEVHVWRGLLNGHCYGINAMEASLGEEERRRAARFYFAEDRGRYIVSRFVLREVLSRYLGVPPRRVRFSRGNWGKPELEGESGGSGLRFSLSRSHGITLIALARGREVGVDVERIAPDPIDATLGERRFTRKEVSTLRSLEPERRGEAFFWFWVRKEAYLKAMGIGFSIPLDSVETSTDVQYSAGILTHSGSGKWNFIPIMPGKSCAAALVTAEGDVNCRYYDWSGSPSRL